MKEEQLATWWATCKHKKFKNFKNFREHHAGEYRTRMPPSIRVGNSGEYIGGAIGRTRYAA